MSTLVDHPAVFRVRFFPDFIVITETASGWASFLRPQVLIDGENCGSIVGANRASVLMSGWLGKAAHCQCDFSEDSAILLVFSLTFGLICSEIPESLGLYDDTSNDFLVSGPAPKIGRVQTARREANLWQDAAPTAALATLPSLLPIHSTQPALPSGPNLLRLLSIQRK